MDEQTRQEAQALMDQATAYKGLITVLTCRLAQSDDPQGKRAVATLRQDRDWQAFTRWYAWHDRCLHVLARDASYQYAHPFGENPTGTAALATCPRKMTSRPLLAWRSRGNALERFAGLWVHLGL